MRFHRLLAEAASMPWAMERSRIAFLASYMASRAAGTEPPVLEARELGKGREAATAKAAGAVAVINARGTIGQHFDAMQAESGGISTEVLMERIHAAQADEGVKAIVLNWDSYGGTSFGVMEAAEEIRAMRGGKPIISQINSVCCSAAYWLAAAADEIVATPGGYGGSVGVYSVHEDISAALEKQGVKLTMVKAGEHKAETASWLPLSDDARQHMEELVNVTHQQFISALAESRKLTQSQVRERFGDGRSFHAKELVARGMADRIGTLNETLGRLGVSQAPQHNRVAAMRAHLEEAASAGRLTQRAFETALRDAGHMSTGMAEVFATYARKLSLGDPAKSQTKSAPYRAPRFTI